MSKQYDLEKAKVKYIELDFNFLVDDYGFKIIETIAYPSFGGGEVVILGLNDLRIRFIKERGQYWFEFINIRKKRFDWFDWDILNSYIKGYREYTTIFSSDDADSKNRGNLQYQLELGQRKLNQIEESLDKIIEAFSRENVRKVAKTLKRFEKQRENESWGKVSFLQYIKTRISWLYGTSFRKKK